MKAIIFIFLLGITFYSCKKCYECGVDNDGNALQTYCKGDLLYDCIKDNECTITDASGAEIKCVKR